MIGSKTRTTFYNLEASMVFRDGSHIDDVYYTGGRDITIKTYHGRDDEPDWRRVPVAEMPKEWLLDVKAAVDGALCLG